MPIVAGGVLGEHGDAGRTLKALLTEINAYAPRESDEDYVVDLGFFTWADGLGPLPPGAPTEPGVTAWMVGRKQRRFIVKIAPPTGLAERADLLAWLAPALSEVATLCREYLPKKARAYPATALADEIEQLAAHLNSTT